MRGNRNNPQSLNRASYVANDPVNWRDPSGLQAITDYEQGRVDYANCVDYALRDDNEAIGTADYQYENGVIPPKARNAGKTRLLTA